MLQKAFISVLMEGPEREGEGGGGVHLDTLALEEGIHQLQAPFHASGLDIRI